MQQQPQPQSRRPSLLQRPEYIAHYVRNFVGTGAPVPVILHDIPDSVKLKEASMQPLNVIYRIDEHLFVHVNNVGVDSSSDGYGEYRVIGPPEPGPELMSRLESAFSEYVVRHVARLNEQVQVHGRSHKEKIEIASSFFNAVIGGKYDRSIMHAIHFDTQNENYVRYLKYHFLRRRVGHGLLEPFLHDPHLEDISIVGEGNVYVVHKVFGPLRSPVTLTTDEIDELVIGMSEQFGKTISHARPLVDATLPEGSRINIVFGKDVSRRGTNATIRRFASVPLSITQIVNSRTMDSREAAYMWMMAEHGMSIFINGETASGKTTTMMGIAVFIPSNWKVVSIEDTPEITIPHSNWISEVTRDTGSAHSSVTMFDLLKAALRQRPNYILVGEIRGAEANIAFQAMQTGHPVMSTFHAAQMSSLIQRLVGAPMKIPKPNMDNLNVALFQAAVQGKDGKPVRRVLSINEIVGYNPGNDSVMFIPVFNWDPSTDSVMFRGKGSSNLFLTKLLLRRGMSRNDEGLLYDELELRSKIITAMIGKKVFNYYDVYNYIVESRRVGLERLLRDRLG